MNVRSRYTHVGFTEDSLQTISNKEDYGPGKLLFAERSEIDLQYFNSVGSKPGNVASSLGVSCGLGNSVFCFE
jgi:hypothetical protein